jgi:alpha-D-ribose 1-methylphosphonate 5-triphosphate synthase subunit PhnL
MSKRNGPQASPILSVDDLAKQFTLHLHEGKVLPVLQGVAFSVFSGECVVLGGPSGIGKSSILKMIYGNYVAWHGRALIRHDDGVTDIVAADAQTIMDLRRHVMGYVSQFLRVIPRVATLDVVAEPARDRGVPRDAAHEIARGLLTQLNLPRRLWSLPPATFSGGEQQRVNIARGFAGGHPLLILDEPTASLDEANRAAVIGLIEQRKAAGTAFVGIFHDALMRERVADRIIDVSVFAAKEAA